MINKMVFIGTDFLIPEYNNGGSQRARAILKQVRKIDPQAKVHSYPHLFPNFLKRRKPFPSYRAWKIGYQGAHPEILRFMSTKKARKTFLEIRESVLQCDENSAIVFDHPWGYLAVEGWIDKLDFRPKLIYSSQNIDHIYLRDSAKPELRDIAYEVSRGPEMQLVKDADLVIATTQTDLDFFRQHKNESQVIQISNGTGTDTLNTRLPEKFLFYIGSGHEPNFIGLEECLNGLSDDTGVQLVIAGNICDLLEQRNSYLAKLDCVRMLGAIPTLLISQLYRDCTGVIISETAGSGSNIKCAEALMSGKSILATRHGMRGYEQFTNSPGVTVTDSTDQFVPKMKELYDNASPTQKFDRGDSLYWDQATRPFIPAVESLLGIASGGVGANRDRSNAA